MTGTPAWRSMEGVSPEHLDLVQAEIERRRANEQIAQEVVAELLSEAHTLRLTEAQKMDADPRTFVRAICSCGDYTSSVDSPSGATRAWLAHWTAKTRGIGR